MRDKPFVAVEGQRFCSIQEWINRAKYVLTAHPNYLNTEHGEAEGWRGNHFTALCFDQEGRRCRKGGDFQRAVNDDAYPIWWVWPDQIADLLMASAQRQIEERSDTAPPLAGHQPDTNKTSPQ